MRDSIPGHRLFVPHRAVSNERIARAIPGWSAERIEEKVGIRERRFLWDIDAERGRGGAAAGGRRHFYPANNTDMCEVALNAGAGAGRRGGRASWTRSSSSPARRTRPNFNHDAMELHRRLGAARRTPSPW